VTDVTPPTGKPLPVVPPALTPDSGTTCKWIVGQIKEGHDEMTVKYLRYCPDDCRKLDTADSAEHAKFCGEGPGKHGDDTTKHGNDTCEMLHAKLDSVKPGAPGRADLEKLFAMRCKEVPPIDSGFNKPPHDTTDTLPHPTTGPGGDTCKFLLIQLDTLKPGAPGRADAARLFALRAAA
jgi:hypothetical protein